MVAGLMQQALAQGDVPQLEALIRQMGESSEEGGGGSGRRPRVSLRDVEMEGPPPGFPDGGAIQNDLFEDDDHGY